MKNIKSANFYWLLLAYCTLVIPSSCLLREEGCRDVSATNFEADAEDDCENCCIFPNISFQIDHTVGDTSLTYGDTIEFDNKLFAILEATFYINGFSLTGVDSSITIFDEITLTDRSGNDNVTINDIELISRDIASFSYEIGSFRDQGPFDMLNFQVGLTPIQAATNPESVPDDHPLAPENGRFALPDSTFLFSILRIDDLMNNDTIEYNINTVVNISLPYSVTINSGFDLDIPVTVDYLKWIEGINFADDPLIVNQIMVGNLPNAFTISE